MTRIPRRDAVSTLMDQVEHKLGVDDLTEVYNELFPARPAVRGAANDADDLRKKIVEYVSHGLETEEIVDLWNVVFPEHRRVSFDDETDSIEFSQDAAFAESGEEFP